MDKKLLEYGDKLLDISIKYNHFDDFVSGFLDYKLEVINPFTGEKEASYMAVVETIYNRKRNVPDSDILDRYTDTLCDCLSRYKGSNGLLFLLRQVGYQLSETKAGRAPGLVDFEKIISAAKKNFEVNKEFILNQTNGNLLEAENNYLGEYGHKFM